MAILGWVAWSEDLRFTSRHFAPSDLPHTLQWVIVYRKPHHREMITGARSDDEVWYVFYPDKSVKQDEGNKEEVQKRHPSGYLVMGAWTSDKNYARITKEALYLNWDGSFRNQDRAKSEDKDSQGCCD